MGPRKLLLTCSVVVITVASLVVSPGIASAKAVKPKPRPSAGLQCGTGGIANHVGFFFDTVAHPSYEFEGASTYIVVQTSAQCASDPGKDNFSNAYAMIASGPGRAGWAQSGFSKSRGGSTTWFGQYYRVGSPAVSKYSSFAVSGEVGVKHAFRELYSPQCGSFGCIELMIDSTTWLSTPWNPFNEWDSPFAPQFEAEAQYKESDVPGLSTSRTAYSALGAQLYDDSLISMPCVLSAQRNQNPRYAAVAHGCIAFDIYTLDGA